MEKQQLIHDKWSDLGITLLISQYDFDGWIDVNELEKDQLTNDLNYKKYSESDSDFKTMLCRPKSLQGIESNNGWIRIESEEQYDELENGEYEWYNINNRKYDKGDLWSYGIFTHYKIVPIIKSDAPLY